mgnify:FL=1
MAFELLFLVGSMNFPNFALRAHTIIGIIISLVNDLMNYPGKLKEDEHKEIKYR